jgi:hypothetical protein
MLVFQHRFFQFFLVIGKQSVNLAAPFVADRMNLWAKLLSRGPRILIQQRLNLICMDVFKVS